jgi:hypothetical protein
MKLALLGADDESLALIRWAVREGGHELVSAFDLAGRTNDVQAIAPQVRLNEDWESLVLGSTVDAVIIARAGAGLTSATGIPDDERRAEQLRKLAQAAVPMLVFCPACEAIVGFEIEMIRRDVGGVILPVFLESTNLDFHYFFDLYQKHDSSPIGRVEQILIERQQLDRSRNSVLTRFARDVALIREQLGDVRSINASGPPVTLGRDPLGPKSKELPSLANLSMQMGGDWDVALRWSMGPVVEREGATVVLLGSQGRAKLSMPADGPWVKELQGDVHELPSAAESNAAFNLRQLQHARDEPPAWSQAWLNACRDQEVAEAVDRSLARGRTIELFGEEHTEEDSFKGVMAVGGCLLLSMALLVVFVATVVEGLRLPLRDWMIWKYWPIYLLVPVVVFLLLQLLQFAVKRDDASLRRIVHGGGPGS